MVTDIVCKRHVDESNLNIPNIKYNGLQYYFCTNLCMVQFKIDPERYLADTEKGIIDKQLTKK